MHNVSHINNFWLVAVYDRYIDIIVTFPTQEASK